MYMTDSDRFEEISDIHICTQLLRNEILMIIHSFFIKNNFVLVDPPLLHENIRGKKSEIYISQYNRRYSLNSSNALYLSAFSAIFKKVYSISPAFRDEHKSKNHLLEFRMLEAEIVGMKFEELIRLILSLINYTFDCLLTSKICNRYNKIYNRVIKLKEKFNPISIKYVDFIKNYQKLESSESVSMDDYLIADGIDSPIIITDFPIQLSSWTAKQKNNSVSYSMNLILPETFGELCDGCERSCDIDIYIRKFKSAKINKLGWFIQALKIINEPRCGFGMGIDRLVRWIAGVDNISDTLFFPRRGE